MTTSDLSESYSHRYLHQYWPESPHSAAGWEDNIHLMNAYQEVALAALKFSGGRKLSMLDISTGPALAPLLAMMTCVSEVQLSDYEADNRRSLRESAVEYWRNYVPMLTKVYEDPEAMTGEILARLDELRRARPPVEVDLFRDEPFSSEVNPERYDIVSMNFVADSIAKTKDDYFQCLNRVTRMIRPGAFFVMSALVDCDGWLIGEEHHPSPKVSEAEVLEHLKAQGFELRHIYRLPILEGLSYNGGWIVLGMSKRI